MKKLAIVISIILVMAIGGFLFLSHFLNGGYIGDKITEYSKKFTGSPATTSQSPQLSWLPPQLVLENVKWNSPDRKIDVSIKKALIKLDIWDLLTGGTGLRELDLTQPLVVIADNDKDRTNTGVRTEQSKSADSTGMQINLDRLIVQHGQLRINNSNGVYAFDQINLSAENLHPRQDADVKCDFVFSRTNTGSAQNGAESLPSGNLAFKTKIRYYEPNLTFRNAALTFTATKENILQGASPFLLNVEGALDLHNLILRINSASLNFAQGRWNLTGDLALADPAFTGETTLELNLAQFLASQPSSTQTKKDLLFLTSPANFHGNNLSLSNLVINHDKTRGTGQIDIQLPGKSTPAAISGELSFTVLEPVLPSSTPHEANSGPAVQESCQPDQPDISQLPQIHLRLQANDLVYKRFNAKDVRCAINGENGKYQVDDFNFTWAGGKVEAAMQCDLTNQSLVFKSDAKGINAGRAIWEMGIDGFENGIGDFSCTLTTRGYTLAEINHNLNGQMQLNAQKIKMDFLEEITSLLPVIGKKKSDFTDTIDNFTTKMDIANGIITIKPISATSPALNATGDAMVDLPQNQIKGNLRFKLLNLNLPLVFHGPLNKISWGLAPNFMHDLTSDWHW